MDLNSMFNLGGVSAAANLTAGALVALVVLAIWSLVWKGLALWKSARKNSPIWFVILLIVNTAGILEILYIFLFSKMSSSRPAPQVSKKKKR